MASPAPVRARHHPWPTVPYTVTGVLVLLWGTIGLGLHGTIDYALLIGAGAVQTASSLVTAGMPACEYVPTTNSLTRRSPLRRRARGPFTPSPGQRFAVHENAVVLAPEGASHGPAIVRRNRVHPNDWGALAAAVSRANARTAAGPTAFGDGAALAEHYRHEWRP
ncbi:hypothetical protein [Nocardiopsis suaedae]|uniref:Uncharacterized protein n=1 Tax=Nocardiopsis suaedae TaxID=3018444 RepID=A0ABT4TRB3_9ACTN|nr:hypothetical protein [Nocardiopsis suaedae]MDA2807225.1 hypothetical protein [Nocardiopsis suaedae]